MARILIVDDERAIRSLLALAFVRAGHDVETASDAATAIQALNAQRFDAVLSDVQMPGKTGHDLMRWVAAANPHVQTVLMSGFDVACGDCPVAGRCVILRKPFSLSEAVATISQALRPCAA